MYWLEVGGGLYVIFLIILGLVLHDKRGVDFGLTYMWGVAVGCIAWVIIEATTGSGRIDISSVLIALFTTGFAVFMTIKK